MSGLACLSEEEKDLGSLVLDIGGGTSSLSLFMEGKVIYTDTIAIGGIQLTRDIAKVLSISIQEAERLKVFEGTVFAPSSVSQTASARSSGIPPKGDNFILGRKSGPNDWSREIILWKGKTEGLLFSWTKS